ncbi:MAG: hypothetical protein II643_00470, partial [Oscillospiraceae bacterium]|nr:hypothetical protein [Oscillospiraceae bacterium]
ITLFNKEKNGKVEYVTMERTNDDDGFWEGKIDVPYEDMCIEIRDALLQVRQDVRDTVESQKKPVVCPYCGATTTPTANGTCEFCGGALN